MHKEATSSLRMQTASPGFVSHPSPHPATGRPKLKRRSETQHPAPCAPRKSHKTPLRRRLPLPSRLVSHLPSASLGHDTDRKNRAARPHRRLFPTTDFTPGTPPGARSVNMPKNKGKGGKNRRRGKNENECVADPPSSPFTVSQSLTLGFTAMRSASSPSRRKARSTPRFSRCWATADSMPWYALPGHKTRKQRKKGMG